MNNPCKIDARKRNAKNMEIDAKREIKFHQKYNKNDTKKHYEK